MERRAHLLDVWVRFLGYVLLLMFMALAQAPWTNRMALTHIASYPHCCLPSCPSPTPYTTHTPRLDTHPTHPSTHTTHPHTHTHHAHPHPHPHGNHHHVATATYNRGKRVTASVYVSLLAAACCLLVSAVVISSVQGPVPAIACTRPDHSRFCTQNDVTDAWGNLVRLLLIPGMVDPMKSYMAYPVLPWLPACLIGVLLAHYFKEDVKAAQGNTLYLGQAALALFVVVRIAGGHGLNFRGWPLGEGRESPLISFLNECKYPPSTAYLLLTLGFSLVLLHLLWKLDCGSHCWLRPLVVFGRSPLVLYVVHFYLVAAIAVALSLTTGDRQVGSLLYAFPIMLAMLPILYVVCLSYGRFKDRTLPDSLWRLL
eukprot:jgi/Mesvir1/14704/Mv05359-RA.2